MLRCVPPAQPTSFSRTVASAQAKIARLALAGRVRSDEFQNLWSPLQAAVRGTAARTCGFCEGRVTGMHLGGVEHYHPKAMLQELPSDPALCGREEAHGTKVPGRDLHSPLCEWGYHWLAYEWSNYLLACESCNRWWKKRDLLTRQSRNQSGAPPRTPAGAAPLHPCWHALRANTS